MTKLVSLVLVAAIATGAGGCGKVAAGLAKGLAHDADNAAAAAARSTADDDLRFAGAAASHGDDSLHGSAADEAAQSDTPVTDFAIDVLDEAGQQGIEQSIQGAFDNDEER